MSVNVLQLNDIALTFYNQAGEQVYAQPAGALWDGKTLKFGYEANSQSRVHPQQFNHRYLATVSGQPLPTPLGPAKNHADLIYHHLLSLDLPNEPFMLAIPAHWNNEQLSVLLGICQEARVQVAGFADLGLAHALALGDFQEVTILDVELHRLTATTVAVEQGRANITDTRVWEARGSQYVYEGWMSVVADEFVQHTRFDPLHSGASEQNLYDQLVAWAQSGQSANPRLTIDQRGDTVELEVQRADLSTKLAQRFASVELNQGTNYAVSAALQGFPGLRDWIVSQVGEIISLPELSHNTFAQLSDELSAEQVVRISSARCSSGSVSIVNVDATLTPELKGITHLVSQGIARPVHEFQTALTQLKQDRVAPGDVIEVDGRQMMAIKVE